MHVLESPAFEAARNHHHASSVEWGIDNAQVFLVLDGFLVDGQRIHLLDVCLVYFFSYDGDVLLVASCLHVLILYLVDLVDDALVVWRQYLCSVFPVCLVAVVLAWIVAGSDVHTALASQVAYGERDFRGRTHVLEEIDVDAVGCEDVGNAVGEHVGIVAAVDSYDHTDLVASSIVFLEIVGKSLCCCAYRIDVHAVGAGTHDAPQSTSTKLKSLVETVNQFCLVFFLKHCLYGILCLCVEHRVICPFTGNRFTLL